MSLTVTDYSEKSIVVRGDGTKAHKEELKHLGGKWNSNLTNGAPGWIFSKKNEAKVKQFVKSLNEEAKEEKESPPVSSNVSSKVVPTEFNLGPLITHMTKLSMRHRMALIHEITRIALEQPEPKVVPEPSKVVASLKKLKVEESDSDDSDSDSDSDDEAPPQKLLSKK